VRAQLRILGTSDLHMHLTGYDYYADQVDSTQGLTYTASLIHAARTKAAERGAREAAEATETGVQGGAPVEEAPAP